MRLGPVVALTVVCAGAGLAAEPQAQVDSVTRWTDTGTRKGFGGFSGLEVSDDGATFRAINDNAITATGRFKRDGGRIVGVETDPLEPLFFADARPIWAAKDENDAEGLALLPDGRFVVSFEGDHRLMVFGPDRVGQELPRDLSFSRLAENSGFEALAVDAEGALYVIPERSGRINRDFPVYRWRGGTGWDAPFSIRRDAGFLPVGADFARDGRLYLLERGFAGFGFRSRVRVLMLAGTTVTSDTVIFTSRTGQFDNLEGLSVWTDAEGRTRLTLVSDDNYKSFQQTQFVELVVTE